MRLVARDGVLLPLVDVGGGRVAVAPGVVGLAHNLGDVGHGPDADDALERQVRLVGQPAGEVVGAQLVVRYQRLPHQVARPLLPQPVRARQPLLRRLRPCCCRRRPRARRGGGGLRVVPQGIGQGEAHDEHVPAFLDRHVLVVAVRVARRVREVRAEVVHAVVVRVLAAQLVLEQRLEQVLQPFRVGVQEEGEGREDDVHRLEVAVGRDLFEEEDRALRGPGELRRAQDLAGRKRGNVSVLLRAGGVRIACERIRVVPRQ